MHKPALLLQHSVDGLSVDADALAEAQHCPDAAVAKRRVCVNELLHTSDEQLVQGPS